MMGEMLEEPYDEPFVFYIVAKVDRGPEKGW
jgi:hypothetical protein